MNTSPMLRRAIACSTFFLISLPLACHAAELSGRITAADGITPLQGIEVQARFEESTWYGATTDSNGDYQFPYIPAATYRIRIEDNTLDTYIPEWHENAPDYASATPFVLAESDVVSGVNASLAVGGRLVGTITADIGGAPLPNIRVSAFRFVTGESSSYWQEVKSRPSLSDGTYNIGGLEDGSYRLRFSDDAGNYAPEHHANEPEFNNADSIIVAAAGTVTNDASLANSSRIQGTVTDEGGLNPLQGVYVYAFRDNGSGTWNYVNQTTTQTDGSFDLRGLTAGDHRIQFNDASGFHQQEYYQDTTDFNSATILTLGLADTLTGKDASLAGAGRIEGTITDGSAAGVPSIDVIAYRWNATSSNWEYFAGGYTDADGFYSVGGLPAGTYRVGTYDNSGTYPETFHANASNVGAADDVEVIVGSTTYAIDITLEAYLFGSISGTVTDSGSNPLTGIGITLFRYNTEYQYWEEIADTTTGGTGQYRYENVVVGTYKLRFLDATGTYATEYHLNAYTPESGLDVEVTNGNETVVNAELAEAASISGTVTNNVPAPVPGIWVNLYRFVDSTGGWQYLFSRISASDGTYTFEGLPDGTFVVEFADYNPVVTYGREYYNGKPTFNAADPVILSIGQIRTNIDASLELAGQITGTVTADAGGSPLQFVTVTAHRLNEAGATWDYASSASTNASGVYLMQGLVPGQHRVQFYDASGSYLREYYNDKATPELADSLTVPPGAVLTAIDASLATASRIEGTVTEEGSGTPLPNVSVEAYKVITVDSFEYASSATTDSNGNYSLGGLPAGTYRIQFYENDGLHLSEVYANAGSLNTGTDIAVGTASITAGRDAALVAGGRISGTVTHSVSTLPLPGIDVYFYRFDGASWPYQDYVTTDHAGSYTSPALPSGQYRIEFSDGSSQYRSEYFNNIFNFDDATPVTVSPLQTMGSINAALSPIGQSSVIAGTITDDDTLAPLAGIFAQAFRYDIALGRYEFEAEASSDSAGIYAIENLRSGVYRIRFSDLSNGAYAQQFFWGSHTLNSAFDITLDSEASVSFIDASMRLAQTISGTVRDESGDGIPGVSVLIRRWEPVNNAWFLVNSAETLADGTYSVGGLAEGTYRIEFVPVDGSGYYGEFYNDVQTINDAEDLDVFQFSGQTNIDAELSTSPPVIVEPVMTGFRRTGPGTFEADFQGQPGRTYRLERSATMLSGTWIPDGAPFTAQSGGDLLTMSSTEPRMFWRVRDL